MTAAPVPPPQTDSVEQPPAKPRTIWWLIVTLGVMAAGLLAFLLYSSRSAAAHKAIPSSIPPIYGRYEPSFSAWGYFAIVGALIAGGAAYALARAKRQRAMWVIPIAIAIVFSFGAALAMVNGNPNEFVSPLKRTTVYYGDYQADVHLVRELGVRKFVKDFPQILKRPHALIAAHSRTHPPGSEVLLSVLQSWFPKHLIPRALFIAFFSSLVMIPTWFIARAVAGERAALVAVSLLAVAPAPGVYIFLNLDALHATLLAGSAALLTWGLTKKDSHWATMLAGGLLLGFTSFFSYQITFIAGFALLYSFFVRPWREAVKLLAIAGVGGLLAMGILRLAVGFNFVASLDAARHVAPRLKRVHSYWFFGDPAVWLIFAGLPIAALGVRELITKRPAWLWTFFTPLVLADLTTLFLGETERVGQFAAPFLAAAAGAALVRWEKESGRDRPGVIAALVLLTAAQAIVIEALFWTVW
ncbi:MAG TPA: glycosyltransferase family 39 protein [Actinomycetota bacterium]|nr:glycosyltransferase family 39 protein [Actinomycetota bacterium]